MAKLYNKAVNRWTLLSTGLRVSYVKARTPPLYQPSSPTLTQCAVHSDSHSPTSSLSSLLSILRLVSLILDSNSCTAALLSTLGRLEILGLTLSLCATLWTDYCVTLVQCKVCSSEPADVVIATKTDGDDLRYKIHNSKFVANNMVGTNLCICKSEIGCISIYWLLLSISIK